MKASATVDLTLQSVCVCIVQFKIHLTMKRAFSSQFKHSRKVIDFALFIRRDVRHVSIIQLGWAN